ncbi:hypothetical protein C8F01DRAFT_1188873 [Mycena amicta]|nr:hypothetical protein C8F01DRAFT_1188873 [Mycena amicta]
MENVPLIATAVDDLWFPDGTLVIRAGAKLFKVFQSVLAARSTVFRDMLALPQEPMDAVGEVYEGCPSVTLTDDGDDVEVFLRAIFDSSYFMPHPEPFKRLPLLGILRLSHKYDVEYLFKRALKHLEPAFPFAFSGRIESWRLFDLARDEGENDAIWNQLMTIGALRRVGALWLLPAAFYVTCQSLLDDLLAVRECKNVDLKDIILCLRGQRSLSDEHAFVFSRFLCDSSDKCPTKVECEAARKFLVQAYFDSVLDGSVYNSDILGSWVVDHQSDGWSELRGSLCEGCFFAAEKMVQPLCQSTWESLPEYFSLPQWDKLLAARAAVMGDA